MVKELLSAPAKEHFHDVELDEAGNYLSSLCDPAGAWGKFVLADGQASGAPASPRIYAGVDVAAAWAATSAPLDAGALASSAACTSGGAPVTKTGRGQRRDKRQEMLRNGCTGRP